MQAGSAVPEVVGHLRSSPSRALKSSDSPRLGEESRERVAGSASGVHDA